MINYYKIQIVEQFKVLDRKVAKTLSMVWHQPCEAVFEYLSIYYIEQLSILIKSGVLKSYELTYAAEYMGRCNDSIMVRDTLVPLLSHPKAVVREGALIGLNDNHINKDVKLILISMSKYDKLACLRKICKSIVFNCDYDILYSYKQRYLYRNAKYNENYLICA